MECQWQELGEHELFVKAQLQDLIWLIQQKVCGASDTAQKRQILFSLAIAPNFAINIFETDRPDDVEEVNDSDRNDYPYFMYKQDHLRISFTVTWHKIIGRSMKITLLDNFEITRSYLRQVFDDCRKYVNPQDTIIRMNA